MAPRGKARDGSPGPVLPCAPRPAPARDGRSGRGAAGGARLRVRPEGYCPPAGRLSHRTRSSGPAPFHAHAGPTPRPSPGPAWRRRRCYSSPAPPPPPARRRRALPECIAVGEGVEGAPATRSQGRTGRASGRGAGDRAFSRRGVTGEPAPTPRHGGPCGFPP